MDNVTFTSDQLSPLEVVAALGAARFEVGRPRKVRRTLLDSFDGRLHGAGLRLELRGQPGLELVLDEDGSAPARLEVARAPSVIGDLPPGPLRSRLGRALDVRALLPTLIVTCREVTAVRKDRAGKAKVTVTVVDQVKVDGREELGAGWGAEVGALAGYEKDAAQACDLLRALGMEAGEGDVLDAAAARAGVDLRGFISSPTVALHPQEEALGAFRRVLANLARAIDANWQGTVDDVDPEFLHDLRVAVRRTRSVLAQGKRVLPVDIRDTYREGFGWLGTATGRARDLDVYVIEWGGYVAPLGPESASALGPVLQHISRQRSAEHATLAKALRSARYRKLLAGWHAWLDGPAPSGTGKEAERDIAEVASDRTARAQDQLLARGRSIGPGTPAEELHELRKDAKKLRYLLECFGGLYAPVPRKAFVQRLKALQDNLGEHQDAEVHVSELRTMSSELHGAPGVGPETLVAMGQLTEHLERRRRRAREEFAHRFAAYDTKRTRRTLEELLTSAAPKP